MDQVRTYSVSKHPVNGRDLLTVHGRVTDMPFNVWRDVFRLAGKSWDNLAGHCVFEFLRPNIEEGERILQGALWQKR